MVDMERRCLFDKLYSCSHKDPLSLAAKERIIKASKQYEDGLHIELEEQQEKGHIQSVPVHRKCVDRYCHQKTIQKARRDKLSPSGSPEDHTNEPKRARRSEQTKFVFLQHCLFCGQTCEVARNPKNPDRWRPAYVCREGETFGKKGLKESILEVCDKRKDIQSEQVKLKIGGVLTDLHAADVRYHVDCKATFMSPKSINAAAQKSSTITVPTDSAFDSVVKYLAVNKQNVYNSIDIYTRYVDEGGNTLSRRQLLPKIVEQFGSDLITLSSPGIASILAFKSNAAKVLHLMPDDTDDIDVAIDKVAKQIEAEIGNIEIDRENYHSRINKDICSEFQSDTLREILSKVSHKLKQSLPALLIGNITTSVVKNLATPLQIALAVSLRESKEQVRAFYDFGVTCSYDEHLRFKKSVASVANSNMDLTGLKGEIDGLTQGVGDNFDQEIFSQNGKLQTHSMALLMTQIESKRNQDDGQKVIPRLTKSEMTKEIPYDLEISRYTGPKKPTPPKNSMKVKVPTLAILAQTEVALNRARERDFEFLKDVCHGGPEYNGYNMKIMREEGQALQPKTKAIYLPLIDMPPAEYDTMLTSMLQMKRLSEVAEQPFTLFTLDQQLYRYAVEIQWTLPELFPPSSFILRLGGMHMLMSFIGAVGNLMTETGLGDIMSSVFAGVNKMLIGKKFPMCMRALRMVVEVILEPIIENLPEQCYDTFMHNLEERAKKSRTCKLWLDCLIKPILIMMAYVRAEREGDWPLHVSCVKAMMPYLFAGGHHNYARSGLVYLRTIENLPENILPYFLSGKHVMRHKEGIWNAIWSDMFIESTFMRYGHGRTGIVGITLKPETLKTWALSRHVCSQLMEDLIGLRGHSDDDSKHKEEGAARMISDSKDREGLKMKLDMSIHPLKPELHPEQIVNVTKGSLAASQVNVDQAILIGQRQLIKFESELPSGFWATIEKKVKTMSLTKKGINIGSNVLYDTELILSRVIGLQASSREVDFKDVLSYELAPIPTALFDDSGEMRICKSKSDLKNSTKVEVSERTAGTPNCTVLDGCAILWSVSWPTSSPTNPALVSDYVESFKQYLQRRLRTGDVYLVFDRYIEYSTKSSCRKARGPDGCRVFQLSANCPLPPQNQVLNISKNKRQLIDIIVKTLEAEAAVPGGYQSRLIITGQDNTPVEIAPGGSVIRRGDLKTTHEEGDTIVVAQAIFAAKEEGKHVCIVADDTDIYILLLYHYLAESLDTPMKLQSTQKGRAVIDVQATVHKLQDIIPNLLPAHALSGCDTVPMCYGIGKGKMLKVVKSCKYSLNLLGDETADIENVIIQATDFICMCYNVASVTTLTDARIKVWLTKTGKTTASKMPKLCSLPPTTEAFKENVKRAHYQCAIWRRALQDPPNLEPTEYGWVKNEDTLSLQPVTLPPSRQPAPAYILKLVCCSCASESPCRSRGCGCVAANLACTTFCQCQGSSVCNNEQTANAEQSDDEE